MKNYESGSVEKNTEANSKESTSLEKYGKEHPFDPEQAKKEVVKKRAEIENSSRVQQNESNESFQAPEQILSCDSVRDLVRNFQVKDGRVFSRENGEEITDEQQALEAKAATFIYDRAKQSYQDNLAKGGRALRSDKAYWIDKTLERFSINDENTRFSEGKLINKLLNSGGHLEEEYMKIGGSPYEVFKDDNAFALLRLKFREQGQDVFNYNCEIVDNLQNSVSKATINFDVAAFSPTKAAEAFGDQAGTFNYEFSDQLNEMEKLKKEAEAKGDEDAAKYWRANLEMRRQNRQEQQDIQEQQNTQEQPTNADSEQEEVVEKRKKVDIELSEIKRGLEQIKNILTEHYEAFERSLDQIDELIDGGSTDIDELQTRLRRVRRTEEDLVAALGVFNKINNLYYDRIGLDHGSLEEREYQAEQQNISENSDFIDDAKKKIYASDERIVRFKKYITKIEEAVGVLKKI